MNSHNRTLLQGASAVLLILDNCDLQGVVCGGFARDVQYSLNAKDIDIAVGCQDHSIADLTDFIYKLEESYATRIYWTGQEQGTDGNGNPIVVNDPRDPDAAPSEPTEKDHCVRLVVQIPSLKLDIVFYDTEGDAANLVAQHDCNLNQFVMAGTLPVFLGAFHPDIHGLRITKEGLHPDRIRYMEDKWEAIHPTHKQLQDELSWLNDL